jgi:hypothetical protein
MNEQPIDILYLLAIVTAIALGMGAIVWLIFISEPGQKNSGGQKEKTN